MRAAHSMDISPVRQAGMAAKSLILYCPLQRWDELPPQPNQRPRER
jgi:hypothetical protein